MKAYIRSWFALIVLAVTVVGVIALWPRPARAAGPWYVAPGGDDSHACTSPGTACATINGAIGKASSGDTIKVAIGTYTSTVGSEVVLINQNITLSGGWNSGFTTQSGMSTIDGGGVRRGVTNSASSATVERFIVQNGAVAYTSGGGIYNLNGTMTLNSSTVRNNINSGIYNLSGTMTLNSSTVRNNGGGIFNVDGIMTLNNSTISSNTGNGIILDAVGTLTLNSSTVSGNTYAGISYYSGAAILRNTIVVGNASASGGSDCSGGALSSAGYNLIGNTTGCTFTPGVGDLVNVNAKLGPLVGSPGYHPLLSGSPAIDAGNPGGCTGSSGLLTTDQRGVARVGRCDIGAYEYTTPGTVASVATFGGTPQHAPPLSAFGVPLQVAVLDNVGTPVSSTVVTFSAPASGPSGTFADSGTRTTTAATAEIGIATAAAFTANNSRGTYTVTATVGGVITPATFLLNNVTWYVAPEGDNANDCQTTSTPCATINGALGKTDFLPGDTVLVASGVYTDTGNEVVLLYKSAVLSGGWNAGFTSQNGMSTIDGQGARRGMSVGVVNRGVTVSVERFIVENGYNGGIYNSGTLTLNNSIVSNNQSSLGGGIYNDGTLTLNNSIVSNNTATASNGGGIGNGSGGTLTLNNSTVSGNSTTGDLWNSPNGGGIYNDGTLTLNSSTISNNSAAYIGGGIYTDNSLGNAIVTVQNSIIAGNSATTCPGGEGSGIFNSLGYNLIQ